MRDAIHLRKMALENLRGREGLSTWRMVRQTAIQRLTLAWDGLEGAARPSISMRAASNGFAIGWGSAPRRSHANFETKGGEFA